MWMKKAMTMIIKPSLFAIDEAHSYGEKDSDSARSHTQIVYIYTYFCLTVVDNEITESIYHLVSLVSQKHHLLSACFHLQYKVYLEIHLCIYS